MVYYTCRFGAYQYYILLAIIAKQNWIHVRISGFSTGNISHLTSGEKFSELWCPRFNLWQMPSLGEPSDQRQAQDEHLPLKQIPCTDESETQIVRNSQCIAYAAWCLLGKGHVCLTKRELFMFENVTSINLLSKFYTDCHSEVSTNFPTLNIFLY